MMTDHPDDGEGRWDRASIVIDASSCLLDTAEAR